MNQTFWFLVGSYMKVIFLGVEMRGMYCIARMTAKPTGKQNKQVRGCNRMSVAQVKEEELEAAFALDVDRKKKKEEEDDNSFDESKGRNLLAVALRSRRRRAAEKEGSWCSRLRMSNKGEEIFVSGHNKRCLKIN
ncbi:hypothetical protein L1987_16177 [Smallanthus sonchifolius]|uniref:Uncharacterized protein n=1 Tax=Smallanthus sonchifolius TaxID=185202 RepID=A0ACB9J848_9ASTR|nr:hypothetical protein L1987_16177 [Smallanthus sonchifolius]